MLSAIQAEIGEKNFRESLEEQRPRIIAIIGIDGYEYIPCLIAKYRTEEY
ncbi:hypothetical protein RINTHM_7670 [Richelia intracellularis HM01]|nr:hypothetical protein RINTHM_7670 [Richelia intracellularis HM01]